ncbi:MAG: adenylate/guanylate cyclase domain-containing protein [Reyranella sp.]|jgi:adenylate cyclase|nr:adenylate/guanylate cyclase domain-containing protein [Reyranella sp.]
MTAQRRLAAILVADVVGFSRLVGADETGTLARLATLRREVVDPEIARHAGRLFKETGDGFLAEFASAVQAVTCAMDIQKAAEAGSLPLRIGIHVGDVVVQGDDLMGDGVNIAARIEGIADPGGIAVSRAVYEQVRDRLDVGFADKGEIELKNIGRPVHIFAVGGPGVAPVAPTLALPDKPSIAVLPFQNMSGDPEQEYFTDGMAEDIITALSRFKSLFVIARNSSFTYKGKAVDVRQVGRELGVRYVLEGSVRKAGGKVRITGQLIDAESGAHLWADRFDGSLEDVFLLQDQVTTSVVGAIAPRLRQIEIEKAQRRRPDNLDAYACVMRAMPAVWSFDLDKRLEALRQLHHAIELDPRYALPQALSAWCHAQSATYDSTSDPARERLLAVQLAEAAARLDSDDEVVLAVLAAAYSLSGDHARAGPLIEKALLLNPNSAWTWQRSGWLNLYLERYELALEHFNRSMRISPLDPLNFNCFFGMGAAYLGLRQFEEAATCVKKSMSMHSETLFAHRMLAVALAHAGRQEEARDVMRKYLRAHPDMTIARYRQMTSAASAEFLSMYVEGLRMAGLPE